MKIIYEKKSYKWLPFKYLSIYILVLLFLSICGPIKFEYEPLSLVLMVIYILAFLLFTWIGMSSTCMYTPPCFAKNIQEIKLLKVLKFLIVITLPIKVMLVISSIRIMGMPSVTNFFATLATVYTDMHNAESFTNLYRQIDTFCTVIFYFSTFAGLFWRKKLSVIFRTIIFANVILDLFYQLCFIGTQRSIITVAVLLLTLFLTSAITKNYQIDKKKLLKIVIVIVMLLIVFLNILSARQSLWNTGGAYYAPNDNFNYESLWLIWCRTDKLKYNVCNLLSYFTQGFYGLTLSFQMPFQWAGMLGSVRGLNSIISQIFSFIPDMGDCTYPVRAGIQFHHDGYAYWYTTFPWLASDLTFFGALIYMGIVGRFFMRCWIQTVRYNNPIAFSVLVLLIIQYIFIIANNQLFVQRGESLATVILIIVYYIFAKKFNFDKTNQENS